MRREDAIEEAIRRTIPATLDIVRTRRDDPAWVEAQITASANQLAEQIRARFRELVGQTEQ
jgi:hypothetical protein